MAVKIPEIYFQEYVCCLPVVLEKRVMKSVKFNINKLMLSDEEKAEAVKNANNSKVCDLTDTIKIEFTKNQKNKEKYKWKK